MCGRRVSEPQSVLGDGRCGRGGIRALLWDGTWYSMAWFWYGMVGAWYGMVWYGIVRYGLLWYGVVRVG